MRRRWETSREKTVIFSLELAKEFTIDNMGAHDVVVEVDGKQFKLNKNSSAVLFGKEVYVFIAARAEREAGMASGTWYFNN